MRGGHCKCRRSSQVQDVRELAAQQPGKALETVKCGAALDARSVLEQAGLSTSSSLALTTLSRSAYTLSSPSHLTIDEEDTRQLSPQRGETHLLAEFLSVPKRCASPLAAGAGLAGGVRSNAEGCPLAVRPQRLNRLYLRRSATVSVTSAALESSLGCAPTSASRRASGNPAATAAVAGVRADDGGIRESSVYSSSSGSSAKSSSSSGSSARSGRIGSARDNGGGSSGTRRKRLAPVDLRVSTSSTVLQHSGSAIFAGSGSTAVLGAVASTPGGVAERGGGELGMLSDEGERSITIATDPEPLADVHGAGHHSTPAAALASTITSGASATTAVIAGLRPDSSSSRGRPLSAHSADPTRPAVDLVARFTAAKPARPMEAAVEPQPSYTRSIISAVRCHDIEWPPDANWVGGSPSTFASVSNKPSASAEPPALPVRGLAGLAPALPMEGVSAGGLSALSDRDDGAPGPEAAAVSGRGGGTCRIRMKLHSSNPEQLRPSMLAPLARLLLPYGWSLRGLAVRSGCLELVLEYSCVDGATEARGGSGGASAAGLSLTQGMLGGGTAAAAAAEVISDGQVAELVSYLHRQGLVDPTLEPAVAVQVNQVMRQVQWQGLNCGGGGSGTQASLTLRGASNDLSSWCTDAAALEPLPSLGTTVAAAAAAAAVVGDRPASAAAGGWLCQAAPASAPVADAALNMQPTVAPLCVVAPCTAGPSAEAVLYIVVPSAGLHSCTVRCLGRYLPVQQLHHLSVSEVRSVAAAAVASPPPPPPLTGSGPGDGDGGAAAVAPPVIDWAAAADADGEVFIVSVGGLPLHSALLQVELRAGGGAKSRSSHFFEHNGPDPHDPVVEQGRETEPGQQQLTGTPHAAEPPPPPQQTVHVAAEMLSAAAPVVMLRACMCPSTITRGRGARAAACSCGEGSAGGICSLQEATGAMEELRHLEARILGGYAAAAAPASNAATAPATASGLGAGSEAAREFVNDLGLLLDAAACAGLEEEDAEDMGKQDRSAEAMAAARDTPSFSREMRGLLLQQLGLGGGATAAEAMGETAAVLMLRQHLADTAVTLLAGCIELSLPYTAHLVVECAARWLQLCPLDVLIAAAATGGEASAASAAATAARLEAMLRVTEHPPSSPSSKQKDVCGGGGSRGGDEVLGGTGSGAMVASLPAAAFLAGAGTGASAAVQAAALGPLPVAPRAISGDIPICAGDGLAAAPIATLAAADAAAGEGLYRRGPASRPTPRPNLSAGALNSMPNGSQAHGRHHHAAGDAGPGFVAVPGPVSGPELGRGNRCGSLGPAPADTPVIRSQPGLLGMLGPQAGDPDGPAAPRGPSTAPSLASPTQLQALPLAEAAAAAAQLVRYRRFDKVFDALPLTPTVVTAAVSPSAAVGGAAALVTRPLQGRQHGMWQNMSEASAAGGGELMQRVGSSNDGARQSGTHNHLTPPDPTAAPGTAVAASTAAGDTATAAAAALRDTAAAQAEGLSPAAAALLREFGRQVLTCFTGFASPHLEQSFWLETTAQLQTMCRLYACVTLVFVSLTVARAFFEDGAAAAAFMAVYQGGQALLLAGFGMTGNGRPERLFGTMAACTALRAVCHSLLGRGLAPLPSFVLPVCRIGADVFNEGVAKAVFEQLPVWLFAILTIFLELPTAYALYAYLDGNGAGLLCGCLLLRLACFGSLKTAVVVGTQAVWRMRFLARRRGQGKLD